MKFPKPPKDCAEQWVRYRNTNFYVSNEGRVFNTRRSRLVKGYVASSKNGTRSKAPRVQIRIDGVRHTPTIKNMVWECYNGAIPKGYIVVRKFSKSDALYNLELITIKESGRRFGGQSNRRPVINVDTGEVFESAEACGIKYYFNRNTIKDMCDHKWKKRELNVEWYKDEI